MMFSVLRAAVIVAAADCCWHLCCWKPIFSLISRKYLGGPLDHDTNGACL